MNSKLVTKTILSPNHSGKRCHKITRITPHCMVGQLSVAECGRLFANAHYEASSNYGIGTDGAIGLYVDEDNCSWCSSSADNDNRAITIECASDTKHPYAMNQKVWNSLVDLCVDICQRYGKTKTIWFNDKATTLAYVPKDNEMVFTVHRWYSCKSCPGDWLYKRMGKLSEEVNKKLSQTTFWPEKEIEQPKTGVVYDTEEDRERAIWHFFKVNSDFNDFGIAGLMGNLYSESALRPNNLQNSFEKKLKMTDKSYTTAVNDEIYSREQFINDGAGYGLAQWTFRTRKAALYDFILGGANGHLCSIDDLYLQCCFLLKELVQYKEVYKVLSKAVSVKQASDIVLTQFEKPADQSNSVKNKRAAFGKVYYDKYSDAKKDVVKENLGFYIQYGAFSTKKNAEKRLAEIEKHGFEGKVEKFDCYYRVIHGYFKDRSEVDVLVTAARSKKFDVIVKERKV